MNLEEMVKKVVDNYINNRFAFTTADVSNYVKEEGYNFTHFQVAQEVKRLYFNKYLNNNGYVRNKINVKIGDNNLRTWLYNHIGYTTPEILNGMKVDVVPLENNTRKEILKKNIEEKLYTSKGKELREKLLKVKSRNILDIIKEKESDAVKSIQEEQNIGNLSSNIRPNSQGINVTSIFNEPGHCCVNTGITNPCVEVSTHNGINLDGRIKDVSTRKQRGDCRVEIPPAWLVNFGGFLYSRSEAFYVNGRWVDGVYLFYITTDVYFDVITITNRRCFVSKTILDNSKINHGPGQERSLILLDNGIFVY